jgi:MFS family permease
MALNYTIRYSYAVFMPTLQDTFGWSRTDTRIAYTLQLIFYGIAAPVVGSLFDKYGPKKLFPVGTGIILVALLLCSQIREVWQWWLFGGLLVPLGTVMIGIVPHSALVSSWFVKKRGTAQGLAVAGIGIGLFLAGLYVQWLISRFGFRWAFVLIGMMPFLIAAPLALLFQCHKPQERGLLPDGEGINSRAYNLYCRLMPGFLNREKEADKGGEKIEIDPVVDQEWAGKEWSLSMIIRTYRFWCFFLANSALVFGVYCALINQVDYAVDIGFTKTQAATAFSIVGGVSIFSKIFWGAVSDRIGRETTFTSIVGLAVLGIIFLIGVKSSSQVWTLFVYAGLFGLGYGAISSILPVILADTFGTKALGASYGLSVMGATFGGSVGPLFGGFVRDMTGSFRMAFATAVVFLVTSIVLVWITAPRKVRLVQGRAVARARKTPSFRP